MTAHQPSAAPDPGRARLEDLSAAFTRLHGADPEVVSRTLRSLRRTVVDEDDLTELLDRAAAAVAWLPDADSAGITVSLAGAPFTDTQVVALDEAQYALHHGPCTHAMTTRATVAMSLAEVATSWPGLAARSAGEGVRSFLAAPLLVRARVAGSLNLYSTRTPTARTTTRRTSDAPCITAWSVTAPCRPGTRRTTALGCTTSAPNWSAWSPRSTEPRPTTSSQASTTPIETRLEATLVR